MMRTAGFLLVVLCVIGASGYVLGSDPTTGPGDVLTSHVAAGWAPVAASALSRPGAEDVDMTELPEDALIAALRRPRQKGDLKLRIQALDALAEKGTDSALQVILRFAKSRDPEMKAVAMGSLARFSNQPKAREALFAGLRDRDPNIRAVTLRALGGLRDKSMIPALIEVVGDEREQENMRVSALKLLVRLTNQNMGLVGEDWEKWWDVAEPRFEFPKEDAEGGFTEVQVRDLSYFGIEIASKRLAFLVDISSSMTRMVAVRSESERREETGETTDGRTAVAEDPESKEGEKKEGDTKARKIDVLKRELVRVLQKLPIDCGINIITFHGTFAPWQKQLVPIAGAGRARAIQFVKNLQTGRGTNVFDTLEFALKDRRTDTLYLLTDGQPTRGRLTKTADILEEVRVLNRVRGVTIHCIAFGEESDFLEQLAKENGGQYRFVDRY
jgi:hypothetical protein